MTTINENNSTIDNTQSHWGSGVKFENVEITALPQPRSDPSAAKGVKLSALLPFAGVFLFLAVLLTLAADKTPDPKDAAAREERNTFTFPLYGNNDYTGKWITGTHKLYFEEQMLAACSCREGFFNRRKHIIVNSKFDYCGMRSNFAGYVFHRCSFIGTYLTGSTFGDIDETNDMRDAILHSDWNDGEGEDVGKNSRFGKIANIKQTKSWQQKKLSGVAADLTHLPERIIDLSGFDLRYSDIVRGRMFNIEYAEISGADLREINWEMLRKTKHFMIPHYGDGRSTNNYAHLPHTR
jgi:uncharacterized protein YjbI with pentapeptide repeats